MRNEKEIFIAAENVLVTKPYLPPLNEFLEYLQDIWATRSLSNDGKYHKELEAVLAEYLGVPYVSLFANATLALIVALQALRISGEVITTPYSFVATTHALWWNNIKPVFVDICSKDCNIDVDKIEAAITPKTSAILPVHVYGNPCNVEEIEKISDTYGLRVIYDSAHAFGVRLHEKSIVSYGDMSVLSFHATKIFNTFEGGAIVTYDVKAKKRIDYLKNFGFAGETSVISPGINAKMNEFQASLGLLQMKYISTIIESRKHIYDLYVSLLRSVEGIKYNPVVEDVQYNYAYFPIFVESTRYGHTRDELYAHLKEYNYWTRRYFYPLISEFKTYSGLDSAGAGNLHVANKISSSVLCLPIYPGLSDEHVCNIGTIIANFAKM